MLFMKLGEMTETGVNPLYFDNDPADTRIYITSVTATKVQGVQCTWHWQRYAFSGCTLVSLMNLILPPWVVIHGFASTFLSAVCSGCEQ